MKIKYTYVVRIKHKDGNTSYHRTGDREQYNSIIDGVMKYKSVMERVMMTPRDGIFYYTLIRE